MTLDTALHLITIVVSATAVGATLRASLSHMAKAVEALQAIATATADAIGEHDTRLAILEDRQDITPALRGCHHMHRRSDDK